MSAWPACRICGEHREGAVVVDLGLIFGKPAGEHVIHTETCFRCQARQRWQTRLLIVISAISLVNVFNPHDASMRIILTCVVLPGYLVVLMLIIVDAWVRSKQRHLDGKH